MRTFTFLVALLVIFIPQSIVFSHESGDLSVHVIHMSNNGYDPSHMHIEVGDTVVFENVGEGALWPASNDHPSHMLFPDFDPKEPVAPGSSWEFTFDEAGQYPYHDHLRPYVRGEITVGDFLGDQQQGFFKRVALLISTFFESIFEREEAIGLDSAARDIGYEELVSRYESLVKTENPRKALQALRTEAAEDPEVLALCHDIVHVIGRTAFKRYGDFSETLSFREDYCNSGYIHGVLEEYFLAEENPLEGLESVCADPQLRLFDMWQCHHGVGHGFMYFTGGDLDASLGLCSDTFIARDKRSCMNGAYMEVFNEDVLAHEEQFVDTQDPMETCRTRDMGKDDCYLYVPTQVLRDNGSNFEGLFEACLSAEKEYQADCFFGIGTESIKRNMNNPREVFDLCMLGTSDTQQGECAKGAINMYMFQHGALEAGESLCDIVPSSFKLLCEEEVTNKAYFFE